MNVNYILITLCFLSSYSCWKNQEVQYSQFEIPSILQDTLNISCDLIKGTSIRDSWPKFLRKDKIKENLDLTVKMDSSMRHDFLFESYFSALDSLGLDGLEIYTDYQTSIPTDRFDIGRFDGTKRSPNCYYSVYITNQTPVTKIFMGKDDYIFAIQEAQDGDGRWRPIEHCCFDFCGNGKWGLLIHPGEFITVLFPKYEGNYKTKMRVRIENRDIIYVSKEFNGIVNSQQFFFDTTKGDFIKSHLRQSPESLQSFFYGSIPFEYADKEEE